MNNLAEQIIENRGYPTKEQALKIWEAGIIYRLSRPYGFTFENEYRFHTMGVASAAEKIARYIPSLDTEKAFVLGLLHDYGKRINERIEGRFHGQEGYEQMLKMGYPDVAKVCLTHTFSEQNFSDEEYSYPQEWKDWAHNTLKNITYDDYDYLICLCDKFFEGLSIVPISNRIKGIIKRYQLGKVQEECLFKQSMKLKEYFDKKTGHDIYEILGIKD